MQSIKILSIILLTVFYSQAVFAGSWGTGGSGSGDVVGPGSAVDGNIPVFNGVTGKLIKDSGASIGADGSVSTPAVSGGGSVTLKDLDAPSTTDKDMSQVQGAYVDGADTAENGSLSFWAKIAGTMTSIFDYNPTTDTVDFDKDTTLQAGDILNAEIADGTIEADKLEATNAPVDNYIPSYDSATGGHTWVPNGAGAASGYVTVPTYSDDTCTTGQYSWDGTYYYGCESTDSWDRFAVTWAAWSNPTPIIPTMTSATIPTTGATISLLFSDAITIGSGGNAGWTLNTPTNAMTYSSGDTTDTLVYTLASTINSTDTPTITYTQPGDGLESSTGGDLASITAGAVTNNSTQGGIVYVIDQNFETATTGYDNGETWGEILGGGTIEAAETTTPLRGLQSLNMIAAAATEQRTQFTLTTAITDSSNHFIYSVTSIPTSTSDVFKTFNTDLNDSYKLSLESSGRLNINADGGTIDYGSTIAEDTTYHIWWTSSVGSGSNATFSVYVGTTATRPASPDMTITDSTITTDIKYLRIVNNYGGNVKFDQILMSETDFSTVDN